MVCFALAERLGMPVAELRRRLTGDEVQQWRAYWRITGEAAERRRKERELAARRQGGRGRRGRRR